MHGYGLGIAVLFFLPIILIILFIVSLIAISQLVDAAKMKGHYRDGAGVLWVIGILFSPVVLGLLVAALPDRAAPQAPAGQAQAPSITDQLPGL